VQPFNQYVFSQADSDPSMIMSHSENSEGEYITSYNDALIKAPLLVAQCTIVGIVFGQLMLSRIFYNRILVNFSRDSITNQTNLGTDRRLSLIIILSAVALCVSCTGFLMLQVYNLSSELDLGFSETFSIVINTSLYTVWLLRIITSILILTLSVIFHILSKRDLIARRSIDGNRIGKIKNIVLSAILICGSINIISNGIVSHNAAAEFLPWLAISADWFHVMAVSIWLGGVFYISLILLRTIRTSSNDLTYGRELDTTDEQKVVRNSFVLALMLPYFSMIAIICLGVIGISGLYMALIQLQSTDSLFDSLYGNILILKLCVIAPMIALGAYHQIKLHVVMVQIAKRGSKSQEQLSISSNTNREARYDPFMRFSKTIKVESLIGIAVLTISSFLTITSSPAMVHSGAQMQMEGSQSAINNPDGSSSGGDNENMLRLTDAFTIAASILAAIVLVMSFVYYRKSKQVLKTTLDLLKPQ
ncbi:MAG: copper resistance D family protein, partial [Nitrososphaeraceae archaeon]